MENWKPIEGFPRYEISSLGRVKSYMKDEPIILKGGHDKDGYRLVLLYNEVKRYTKKVHRLVAEAFIPNPDGRPQVNHRNGKRDDNRVENIEWSTCSENVKHAFSELGKESTFERKAVVQIDPVSLRVVGTYESITEASKQGYSQACIGACCRQERYIHKGFIWCYKDDDNMADHIKTSLHSLKNPAKISRVPKPVLQIDLKTGDVVKEYRSMTEASKDGYLHPQISNCCQGKSKTHKGYAWKYK